MVGEGQEGAPGAGDLAVPPPSQAKATQLWDSFSPAHGGGLRGQVVLPRGVGSAKQAGTFFFCPCSSDFLLVPLDYFEVNRVGFRCPRIQHLELCPRLDCREFLRTLNIAKRLRARVLSKKYRRCVSSVDRFKSLLHGLQEKMGSVSQSLPVPSASYFSC